MSKFILFVTALLFVSCTENKISNAENAKSLCVHFQDGYYNSLTKLYFDGDKVFEDTLRTNGLIGLAMSKCLSVPEGTHNIKCSIDSAVADTIIIISDSLIIGISKFFPDKVNFIIYENGSFPIYL